MSMWNIVKEKIITAFLRKITKGLKGDLTKFAIEFRKKAAKTPNPLDDVLAALICDILGIKDK